jgi:hypothetical protein
MDADENGYFEVRGVSRASVRLALARSLHKTAMSDTRLKIVGISALQARNPQEDTPSRWQ